MAAGLWREGVWEVEGMEKAEPEETDWEGETGVVVGLTVAEAEILTTAVVATVAEAPKPVVLVVEMVDVLGSLPPEWEEGRERREEVGGEEMERRRRSLVEKEKGMKEKVGQEQEEPQMKIL